MEHANENRAQPIDVDQIQQDSAHIDCIDLNQLDEEVIDVDMKESNDDDMDEGNDEEDVVVVEEHESANDIVLDEGSIEDTFIDPCLWENIDKHLEDFTAEDMSKLKISTAQHCIQFYNMYAKVKGFGIRHSRKRKSRLDGHLTSQILVCNREGFRSAKHIDRPKVYTPRPITRCGCKARINFKWDANSDSWFVFKFVEEHNHTLVAPSQVSFIRSHRSISEADMMRIKALINSGVRASVTMKNFVQQAGDLRSVGFLKKDLYNACQKIKKEERVDGDAETLMAYLSGKMSSDATFFLRFTRDENDGVDKLFWCDGASRADYKAFGRVVAFDATYKINAYEKPFVVISGVNHHRKTIPFAVALISNEKTETYVWVLKQLLSAGGNMVPYTVVTDGDKAMASAIKQVFPKSRHRLCLWHMMRNIKGHTSKRFCSGFMKCVDRCRTPADFEKAWDELVKHHKVDDKKWAKDLYDDKEKWAESYMRGHFYAGMRSTQRCESMNSTLKNTLTKDLLLYEFVRKYDQVLHAIRFDEDNDDYDTTHSFPVIEGILASVKTHAATSYTRNVYTMVCKEMEYESRYFLIKETHDKEHIDGPVKTYWLQDCEWENSKYVVVHSQRLEKMWCCCLKFESIGIPCRHMFHVMKLKNFKEIPSANILRRWTMRAKEQCSISVVGLEKHDGEDPTASVGRFAYLNAMSYQLCRIASSSYQRSLWLKDRFAKLLLETEKDKVIPKPEKTGVNDPKVVQDQRKRKRKKVKQTSAIPEVSRFYETDQIIKEHDECTFTLNSDNGIISVLKTLTPETYNAGEASEAGECYEVSTFEKLPTVFDWDPRPLY